MPAPTTGRWRSFRAGAFAVLAAQLTIAGHLIAGGGTPDLTLLLALTGLLIPILRGLGRRRRGFLAVLGAMAATQVVFHVILALAPAGHSMATMTGPDGGQHPLRMVVFHLIAAVLSAILLAAGERLIFALYSWFHRALPRAQPWFPISEAASWVAVVELLGEPFRDRLVMAAQRRRGPPAGVVPAS